MFVALHLLNSLNEQICSKHTYIKCIFQEENEKKKEQEAEAANAER